MEHCHLRIFLDSMKDYIISRDCTIIPQAQRRFEQEIVLPKAIAADFAPSWLVAVKALISPGIKDQFIERDGRKSIENYREPTWKSFKIF